jgi:hypothetical protein
MMTVEFITALFYEVDEQLRTIPKHPEAHLWPSEVVTLGLRSYWIPGSYETSSSMSAPSNALPRLRTLCTNSKNPR